MLKLPLAAYAIADKLNFTRTAVHFEDMYGTAVPVYQVTGGRYGFAAFVYQTRLNLDLDGASNAYGLDNPNNPAQAHLDPLESWHKGKTDAHTSQITGLGNACGDPGGSDADGKDSKDKSLKGWWNFLQGTRKFYWAGIKALTKAQSQSLGVPIDDRPELEAGLSGRVSSKIPVVLLPKGMGYFPVINPDTGYYISTTSVTVAGASGKAAAYNSSTYLDSTVVPYAVWANNWAKLSIGRNQVNQGDYGLAIENATGTCLPFVFGDSGTQNRVGECSKKMNDTLGSGKGHVSFIAFPGSGSGRKLEGGLDLLIPAKVLMQTMKLRTNASELAERLAMGPTLAPPKAGASKTLLQTQLYKNFMTALSGWTMTS